MRCQLPWSSAKGLRCDGYITAKSCLRAVVSLSLNAVPFRVTHRNGTESHLIKDLQNDAQNRLRVAAISFLNPAPLLFDFEHEPAASRLRERYDVRYTLPSHCAEQLASGEADLGLIPIAALATIPEVVAVAGCTIASLDRVRSIQLVVRPGLALGDIKTLATDAASRSSAAYVRLILHHFYGDAPQVHEESADLGHMLQTSDAALLIGDPALLALEGHDSGHQFEDHTWIDVAHLWNTHTGQPWVAAVWAVRTDALERTGIKAKHLTKDLQASCDAGLAHIDQLVSEWLPRLPLSEETIRHYLTTNIHYRLDKHCLEAIDYFYRLAADAHVLPPYRLRML
jgi:chorismate dehydratase